MIKNRGVLLFSLGFLSMFIGTYIYFFIDRSGATDFSSEEAEYNELMRQFLVLKGLQDNATNRIRYSTMKKADLEKALGYQ